MGCSFEFGVPHPNVRFNKYMWKKMTTTDGLYQRVTQTCCIDWCKLNDIKTYSNYKCIPEETISGGHFSCTCICWILRWDVEPQTQSCSPSKITFSSIVGKVRGCKSEPWFDQWHPQTSPLDLLDVHLKSPCQLATGIHGSVNTLW